MSTTAITTTIPAELAKDNQLALQLISSYLDTVKTWKGSTPSEKDRKEFVLQALSYKLNPIMKQCYLLPYEGKDGATFTFASSIGGLTSIAARTGLYAGKDQARFSYAVSELESCSVTVYRLVNGQRCGFTATAFYSERAGRKKDGSLTEFWQKQPKSMLEKCAFAAALRAAFPEETGGLYVEEEINNKVVATVNPAPQSQNEKTPSPEQQMQLIHILLGDLAKAKNGEKDFYEKGFKNQLKIESFKELTINQATQLIEQLKRQIEKANSEAEAQDGSLIEQKQPTTQF